MSREALLENGWRRHSVISKDHDGLASLMEHLPDDVHHLLESNDAVVLISTYDCAVVHDDFEDEPWLQLFIAIPKESEKRYSKGRNPRTLHFSMQVNGEATSFETNASRILQIRRDFLLTCKPDPSYFIDEDTKFYLKAWISDRFKQDTWPDSFNSAVKPAEKRLKNFWKRHNHFIAGMYIKLNTYEEMNNYSAAVILLIESSKVREFFKTLRENNPALKDKSLDDIKNSIVSEVIQAFDGSLTFLPDPTTISKQAIEVISEDDMTVSQLRSFSRFSPYSLSDLGNDDSQPVDLSSTRAR